MSSRSFPQLYSTFAVYAEKYKVDIEDSIRSEMSGDLRDACLTIAKSVKNRPAYFAEQLNEAMRGVGTKDQDLVRLIISRSELDLPQIKAEFKRLYKKSLYDEVKSELGGDYKKLMLEIVGKD